MLKYTTTKTESQPSLLNVTVRGCSSFNTIHKQGQI